MNIITRKKHLAASWDVFPSGLLGICISIWPYRYYEYLTSIISIINCSLSTGSFPSCWKQAVVQPLLKKPNLDPLDLFNYRPISKLPSIFFSFLVGNNVLVVFQSSFRAGHSTESALLRVSNDSLQTRVVVEH